MDDEFSSYPIFVDDQSYNHDDSGNDLDADAALSDPNWNYAQNMPQSVYADIEELYIQNIQDQAAELRLPNAATRIYMDLQDFPLQKLAVPLITAFHKVCPHPGNQFIFVTPPERLAFVSMITSALILPPLEYFFQFSLSDLTSIYCTNIDSFTAELISFNILPENEVHFNWMFRARDYSVQYGTELRL